MLLPKQFEPNLLTGVGASLIRSMKHIKSMEGEELQSSQDFDSSLILLFDGTITVTYNTDRAIQSSMEGDSSVEEKEEGDNQIMKSSVLSEDESIFEVLDSQGCIISPFNELIKVNKLATKVGVITLQNICCGNVFDGVDISNQSIVVRISPSCPFLFTRRTSSTSFRTNIVSNSICIFQPISFGIILSHNFCKIKFQLCFDEKKESVFSEVSLTLSDGEGFVNFTLPCRYALKRKIGLDARLHMFSEKLLNDSVIKTMCCSSSCNLMSVKRKRYFEIIDQYSQNNKVQSKFPVSLRHRRSSVSISFLQEASLMEIHQARKPSMLDPYSSMAFETVKEDSDGETQTQAIEEEDEKDFDEEEEKQGSLKSYNPTNSESTITTQTSYDINEDEIDILKKKTALGDIGDLFWDGDGCSNFWDGSNFIFG